MAKREAFQILLPKLRPISNFALVRSARPSFFCVSSLAQRVAIVFLQEGHSSVSAFMFFSV